MAAKHFDYYGDWKTDILTCPKCGWSGTFEQGAVDCHSELMDCSCPSCTWPDAPMLAIVTYPTQQETEAHFQSLSDVEKAILTQRRNFLDQFEREKLRSPSDLPDLAAPRIVLSWDLEAERTAIKHGEQVVWSEPVLWEGAERFVEVVGILRQKYGARLVDVVPTDESGLHLYGDRVRAIDMVENARASLRPES